MQTRTSVPVATGKTCSSIVQITVAVCLLFASSVVSRGALVAYWNFDEPSGTNVFDTAGNPSRTNDGFFASGAETPARVAGRLGGAVGFTWQTPNVTGSGRRVIVPYHTNLTMNGPITISYWYRMDAATPSGTFPGIMRIGSQSATTGNNVGWGFFRTGNMVYKRGNNQPTLFGAMGVGQWYHLALTFNGALTGNNTTGYLNGVAVSFAASGGWSNVTSTTIFEMGRMDQFDQSTLDDLALWSGEALPPPKVRSIYTVPTQLFVDYNIADMRTLWGVFDGAGTSNAVVKGSAWTYTTSLPGSTVQGDAYVSGGSMYVVLGANAGVTAPLTTLSGTFSPGGIGVIGTLAPTNAFAISNANLLFDLTSDTTPGLGSNDLIDVDGDLTIFNSRVFIDPLAPLTTGTYRLANFAGTLLGSFVLSNTTRYTLGLDESMAGQINLNVSGTNGSVMWTSTGSGAWDLSSASWSNLLTSAPDQFYQGDSVLFDDSAAFTTNITVNTRVFPRSVTINSSTRPYIFTGTEQIGGASEGITKNGTSTLILSTPNTFIGDVMVNAGTLRLGNGGALGSTNGQTIVADGATLELAGINPGTENVTVQGAGIGSTGAVVNTGAALSNNGLRGRVTLLGDTVFGGVNRWDVFGGSLIGNGYKLTKVGPPEIALSNLRDTGLGEINVVQGTLTILGSTTLGDNTKSLTVSNNAILAFWATGSNILDKPIVMSSNSIMRDATSGGTDVSTNLGAITVNGDVQFQGGANIALLGVVDGTGNLLKTSGGTLYLGGANTYSGSTRISNGRLALLSTGSINSSPRVDVSSGTTFDVSRLAGGYSVASGQTLAGSGTVAGSLAVPAGGTVLPGSDNVAGTLTVTNGLGLAGGMLTFDIASATTEGAGVNDLVNVGGNLDLTGVSAIAVNPLGLLTVGSTYTLINYTGTLSGAEANLVISNNSRYTFALSLTNAGKLTLHVTGGAALDLYWFGGTFGAENVWDLMTTPNWSDSLGNPELFFGGDQVIFNDFALTNVVDLVGSLTPASIRIENGDANFPYVLTGSGKLSGNSSLTKTFAATTTIANTGVNDYVGPTDIQEGTLVVGTGGTFGNLGSGPITNNGTLVLNRSDNITLANTLNGGGSLLKSNANLLVLTGNNSNYSGTISALGGTLRPTSANALGNNTGGTAIAPGATLDVNAINLGAEPVTAGGDGVGGAGAIVNNAGGQNNALRFVTLSDHTTVGGTGRWDVRAAPTATFSTGGNAYNLTKVGANQFSLVDAMVDPELADINILSGIFGVEVGTTLGNPTNTLTVASNAVVQFFNSSVVVNKVTVLNGGENIRNSSGSTTLGGPVTMNQPVTWNIGGTALTSLGAIDGAVGLTKSGSGTLILGADNTYTGTTTVSAGTLQLGTGTNSGSVAGPIVMGANALTVYRSDMVTLSNVTSTGNLNVRTPAGLVLNSGPINFNTFNVGLTTPGRLIQEAGYSGNVSSYSVGENPGGAYGEVFFLGASVNVGSLFRIGHWPNNVSTFLMGSGTLTLTATPGAVVNQTGAAEQNGIIYLGVDGTGVMIQTGGVVRAHGIVFDARGNTAGTDTFILNGGQTILGPSGIKSGSLDANTSYAINLGGGTLGSSANWTSALTMTLTGTNGDLTVDTSTFTNTLNGALSGDGGLVKEGSGTLRLNGANTFVGTLTVNAGTLEGNGAISGPVVVNPGGTLSPGASIGTLTVGNTLTLGGNTLIELNKTGTTLTNDRIANVTTLNYGGTLTVVASGDALAAGDSFQVFGASAYAGAFSMTALPTLPAPLLWDLSQLSVNGTISVVIPRARLNTPVRSGNTLTLSGSGGYPGSAFRVLRSADITVPLASWTEAGTGTFDSNGNFSVDITINPAEPQLFYAIVAP